MKRRTALPPAFAAMARISTARARSLERGTRNRESPFKDKMSCGHRWAPQPLAECDAAARASASRLLLRADQLLILASPDSALA